MKNYDKVEIEIVRLATTDTLAASGETEETDPKLCGSCQTETSEDCMIVRT